MTLLSFAKTFGSSGSGDGQFTSIGSMKAYNGELFVIDNGNHRIQVFDLQGNYKRQWPITVIGQGGNITANDIDILNGSVYVACGSFGVVVYDLNGTQTNIYTYVSGFGVPSYFRVTSDYLIMGYCGIYSWSSVINTFDFTKTLVSSYGPGIAWYKGGGGAGGMDVYDGKIYFTGKNGDAQAVVQVIDPASGSLESSFLAGSPADSQGQLPTGIAVDPTGIYLLFPAFISEESPALILAYQFGGAWFCEGTGGTPPIDSDDYGFTSSSGIVFIANGGGVPPSENIAIYQRADPPIISDVNVGGSWKSAVNNKINVGGLWKNMSLMQVNIGGVWKDLSPFSATGGDLTQANGYKIHTFTGNGTFTTKRALTADILVVGGGGGAGMSDGTGGPGGAGGLIYKGSVSLNGTYSVVIGAGGLQQSSAGTGNNGSDSTFGALLTAKGGGGGCGGNGGAAQVGAAGGSGGGSGYLNGSAGNDGGTETQTVQSGDSGTYGFGNDGGDGSVQSGAHGTGGGGGAGAAGDAGSTSVGGAGGVGKQYDISGVLTYYAGGGGGGCTNASGGHTPGLGGSGGGGNGSASASGTPGTANTGGGGGGGAYNTAGVAGGSGVVIICRALNGRNKWNSGAGGGRYY